jgi:hypothetical protein
MDDRLLSGRNGEMPSGMPVASHWRRYVRAVIVLSVVGAGLTTACASLLDLPTLEVIDERETTTPPINPDGAVVVDGTTPKPILDGGDAATCVDTTPAAERCAKCGVGCEDAPACGTATQPCSDAGPSCCTGFECKNDKCNACVGLGVSCGSASCCGELRCRSTDYKCVMCSEAGASCGAIGTPCCNGACMVGAGMCP